MTDRIIYTIEPWKPYFGDSGQINGLSGAGGYHGEPVKGEDGDWLIFDTREEAEAEAIKLGYDSRDARSRKLVLIEPVEPLSSWNDVDPSIDRGPGKPRDPPPIPKY